MGWGNPQWKRVHHCSIWGWSLPIIQPKTGRQHACWLWGFVTISCFLGSTRRSPDGELQMSRSTETEAWRWGLSMLGGWTAPTPHRVRSPTKYILLCNICIKASYTLAFQQNSGISLHRFRISFSNYRKRFLCQKANKWFRGVLPWEAWHIKMCGVELIGAFWIWWHKTLCSMFKTFSHSLHSRSLPKANLWTYFFSVAKFLWSLLLMIYVNL